MAKDRTGRQDPTASRVLGYEKTLGQEAIDLYEKRDKSSYPWQQLQIFDIMAVNDDGLWIHTRYGFEVPRRNGKNEIVTIRELWGLSHGEKILHTAHRTDTSHKAWERLKKAV
ncbi:MAG: terminase, partial [Firmicutes bacterium]|nr:terminase [Bacillota bacterium]